MEHLSDQQYLKDQCAGGHSALQQTQLHFDKTSTDVRTIVLESLSLIAKLLMSTPANSMFSAAVTVVSNTFKDKKQSLQRETDKLNS